MTIDQLIERAKDQTNDAVRQHNDAVENIRAMRKSGTVDHARLDALHQRQRDAALAIEKARARLAQLEAEKADDEQVAAAQREVHPVPASQLPGDYRGDDGPGRTFDGAGSPQRGERDRARWVRSSDGRPAAVSRGQALAQHPVARALIAQRADPEAAVIGQHGSLGNLVRAMSTTSGSAIVPTSWSTDLIELARNYAAVLQAGASLVPMDAKVVQVGRLTGDPAAAFRLENAEITASDPTLDNVTLTARTMSTLVIGSLEWFQDADNADQIVQEAIAQAMAHTIDLAALYGSIESGAGTIDLPTPPNPRGVLGALLALLPAHVLGAETDGTVQTSYDEIIDTLYTVRDSNETPNALIWNSKLARQYAKLKDTTEQPLTLPADVAAVERYVSNQLPSYTQGTMTSRASDVFAADWSQLLIGQRLEVTIQTLVERYAEFGQVGIVAHWRGDVQPAHPGAFAVYRALQGAA